MSELRVQSISGNSPSFRVTLEDGSTLRVESDVRVNGQSFVPLPTGDYGNLQEGAVRYNTETNKLEVWHTPNGGTPQWCNIDTATEGLLGTESQTRRAGGEFGNVGTSGGGIVPTVTTLEVSESADGSATYTQYDLESAPIQFTNHGQYTLRTSDVTDVKIELWGAGGGGASRRGPTRGSAGGYTVGYCRLPAGTYTFIVGRGGEGGGTDMNDSVASGGYPDGGDSDQQYQGESTGGGGGGSTRFGPFVSAANINAESVNYHLIAGAGGGGADWVMYTGNRGGRQPISNTEERGEGGGLTGGHGGLYYYSDGASSPGKGGSHCLLYTSPRPRD